MDVRVHTTLTGLESTQLDMWLAAHGDDVDGIEVHPRCVLVHGRHPYLTARATATATRQVGQLTAALNEAAERLRTEGGGC
jgi:hypothetical protein